MARKPQTSLCQADWLANQIELSALGRIQQYLQGAENFGYNYRNPWKERFKGFKAVVNSLKNTAVYVPIVKWSKISDFHSEDTSSNLVGDTIWAYSSPGRTRPLQGRGSQFESD